MATNVSPPANPVKNVRREARFDHLHTPLRYISLVIVINVSANH